CLARGKAVEALAYEETAYLGVSDSADVPPSVRAGPLLEAGAVVGRYRVRELVGAGAMGAVYLAHDPKLDRRVALKLLRHDASSGPMSEELRRRLAQEGRAMARLTHANVVTAYDTGALEG